jgi:hypothetical protein
MNKRTRENLMWELGWTPREIVGIVLGLVLGLGLNAWDLAFFIWVVVLAMSLVVRFDHYSRITGPSSNA